MKWDVTSVVAVGDTSLVVDFRDGLRGTVAFERSYFEGVFSPLADPDFFRQVRVVDDSITWPGELDLAPDALHERLTASGAPASITLR